jgi:peroxiredoxin
MSFSLPVLAPFFGNSAPSSAEPNEPQSLPDFILPTADGGDMRLTERAASYSTLVLIFHRGFDCQDCRAQLAELQSGYNDLRIEGAEVIAIGLDDQLNTQQLAQQLGVRFPMLVDATGVVASNYGLREALETDFTNVILILNGDLQLLATRLATSTHQTLPVEAIVHAIREANGTGDTGGTAS